MEDTIWFSMRLSFQVAFVSTLAVTLVGVVLAYFLATRNFKGKIVCEIVVTLPLILPPTVTGYYLLLIFGRNGVFGNLLYQLTGQTILFTWWAAAFASFIVSLPLMVKTAEAAIASVDKSMIETSYMLGYSEFETAWKVILPLAKNGIIAGIVLSFARAIGEFGATLMLAGNIPGKTNTMPLAIYSLVSSGDWNRAHGMVILLTLISTFFLFLTYRLTQKSRSGV